MTHTALRRSKGNAAGAPPSRIPGEIGSPESYATNEKKTRRKSS